MIKTSVAEMHLDEDGILCIKMLPGVDVTLEKVKEYFEVSNQLLAGKMALVLFDATAEYSITEEAKAYVSGKEASQNRIAIAYLTRSVTNGLMLNLYLKIYSPPVPTRMFSSKGRALKWLNSFYVMPGDKFVRVKRRN
ncbi:MAG TPA: hypothetical protein VGC65_05455 [Bacteroidia bacterium]